MKIILIMGLPGSGKTTLAEELAPMLNAKRLNADEVRKEANDWDFSEEGRKRQAKRMADFAIKLKKEGNNCLPIGCRNKEDAGYCIGDFLKDHPMWRKLVKETADSPKTKAFGNTLVPYSLRHSYSYRASENYGFSDRIAAANMGHSLKTHNEHYGEWFDNEDLESALEKVKAIQKGAA